MKCKEVQYLLPEYIEGTISNVDRSFVAQHLQSCEHCKKELKSIQKLYDNLDLRLQPEPSEHYWTTLLPRIHLRREESSFGEPKWVPQVVVPIVAATVFFIIAIEVFSPRQDEFSASQSQGESSVGFTDELYAMLQEIDNEEIQQVSESSFPFNGFEEYSEDAVLGDDKEVLKSLLDDFQLVDLEIDDEGQSINETLSDQDVEGILSRLQQKHFVN